MANGQSLFQLAFQASPIILTGGIASLMGGMLPIIVLTESIAFAGGLLSGAGIPDIPRLFAQFHPIAGATLIDNQFAKYTFLNRATASNAVIKQPLVVSLRMTCPAKGDAGMLVKFATMTALQATLDQHNQLGGTYTVMTPSHIYVNCLNGRLSDVTQGGTNQTQVEWQWDFEQPLLTEQDLDGVQSNVMQMLGNGGQITGAPSWSGLLSGIGSSLGIPLPGLVPGVASIAGSAIAPIPGISSVPQ